jgi:hypothetical protein
MPFNVQAKLNHNEDLALMSRTIRGGYAKALKGAWMEHDLKSTSNKTVQHKEIGLLTLYHD